MNLGLFLSPGDSLEKQKQSGQLDRFLKYYLQPYSKEFKQIYLFTYGDRGRHYPLPANLTLISKPKLIPTYLYQLIMVFIHWKIIKTIDINRVFQVPGGLSTVISKIFFKKPYVVSNNYDYVYFAKIEHRPILAKLLGLIVPLVLRHAHKIITPSVIPNGVDPLVFKPKLVKQEKYLVLSVGRLVRQKNYELLIKVISLSRFNNKIKLVIIGNGPLQLRLENLAQNLKINLKIMPNVQYQDLLVWYQKAAVFALTSQIEGQPKVLLEAMSCACSCLTTPFSGNIVKDDYSGLVGVNLQELAEKLDRLLSDSALNQQLGRQARQQIRDNFDIRKLIAREIKLLKSIHEA